MRLIRCGPYEPLSMLNEDDEDHLPRYTVLSHTWGDDEVSYQDFNNAESEDDLPAGYEKIRFLASCTRKAGYSHCWVDTCCIDKTSTKELDEAINSMYRWYKESQFCFVYLADVNAFNYATKKSWIGAFEKSRWFQRGWTLQELLAPKIVRFYSKQWTYLGDKRSLEGDIARITGISVGALRGQPLSSFSIDERMSWAKDRQTTRKEDQAYCLLGMFDCFMPSIYGEREHAIVRLKQAIKQMESVEDTEASTLSEESLAQYTTELRDPRCAPPPWRSLSHMESDPDLFESQFQTSAELSEAEMDVRRALENSLFDEAPYVRSGFRPMTFEGIYDYFGHTWWDNIQKGWAIAVAARMGCSRPEAEHLWHHVHKGRSGGWREPDVCRWLGYLRKKGEVSLSNAPVGMRNRQGARSVGSFDSFLTTVHSAP